MGSWIFKQTYRDIVRLSNDEKVLLSNRGRDYKHSELLLHTEVEENSTQVAYFHRGKGNKHYISYFHTEIEVTSTQNLTFTQR